MMDQESVQADDLVRDLTSTTEPVFSLPNKTIAGPLDLRYHTIGPAVDLQGCHFLDDVDLGCCDFEQAVNFTGCTFDHAFNKTDQSTSQPFYCKKDFICDEAIFEGPFSLNDAHIEGNASFGNAQFKSTQVEVDFTGLRSERQFSCNGATFLGSASFNGLKCESGFFNGATFNGTVDLGYSSFGSAVVLTGATFIKDVSFNDLKCQALNAFTDNEYGATTFREVAGFERLKCEGTGSFNGAIFEKDVSFARASFGSDLDCSWDQASRNNTTFKGKVEMYGLKCEGDGVFVSAQFRGTSACDFRSSRFGGDLSFAGSSFSCPLKLDQVEVSHTLNLTAEQFQEVSLSNATIDGLTLSYEEDGRTYTFPSTLAKLDLRRFTFQRRPDKVDDLQFASSLDLRGLTFNRILRSKQDALQFAKAQKPEAFSFDPYAQIEQYYEKTGKDTEARDVHYEGQLAMRRNAGKSDEVRWTLGRKASDTFLRWFTGYGVRTGRVFFLIALFLLLGMLVFSMGDFTPLGEALAVKTSATLNSSAAAQNLSPSKPTVMDEIAYSVDRFIPIDMGFEEGFEPHKPWSKAYDAMHVIAGWLLVPLFLVSWSGFVRSRR
jgi:hypothetical protein